MATNYPANLDTLTNPTATDDVATVDHAAQHANANDAIEALEAKVGVNNSAVTSSHDYRINELEDATSNIDNTSDATKNAAVATLTNKTIDADDNTISDLELDNFKASAIVTEAEGIGSNDNDTTIPTSAAVKQYVDDNAGGSTFSGVKLSATAGNGTISFTTELFDTDGYHESVSQPTRITFPADGYYHVGGYAQYGEGNYTRLVVRLDGTTVIAAAGNNNGSTTTQSQNVSTIIHATAGQYIELITSADGTNSNAETFWAYKIG